MEVRNLMFAYDRKTRDKNGKPVSYTHLDVYKRQAVMDALGLEVQEEAIPEPPESVPEPGTYKVKIKDITDVVKHSLVESETGEAILRVDKNGKMTLSYKMISGTTKEPLHVLGLNGYYTDNNSPTEDTPVSYTHLQRLWRIQVETGS